MIRLTPLALAFACAHSAAETLPMEHILVSVPLHKTTAETALPVTVLSGESLNRAASTTIGDTLSSTPGLANASFGPGVGQPVIRGQQGPRVTTLQNGTSISDASGLSADHAVSTEPMLADSIEVLRGPSTLLYGGGAIGGVVNILDSRIPTSLETNTLAVEYRHDTASDLDSVVVRADGSENNFAWHFDALYRDFNDLEIPGQAIREEDHSADDDDHDDDHEDDHDEGGEEGSKGYVANTGGRAKAFTVGSSYHFDKGFFGVAINRIENTYGIPAGAHSHHEEEGEEHEEHDDDHDDHDDHGDEHGDEEEEEGGVTIDLKQTRYDAALHWHEPLPALEVMRGFLTYTDYEHDEIESSGEVGTRYSNDAWEGRLELVHDEFAGLHGVFGLQFQQKEFSAIGEEAFVPVTDSESLGAFLLEDFHTENWTFEGGLRWDWDERNPEGYRSDSFTAFSLSGSALWNFHEEWRLGLSLSSSERAPAIDELYSNIEQGNVVHAATNAIEIGDPDLGTETANNADLALRWSGASGHWVTVTAFHNDFSDYINLTNSGVEIDETPVLLYTQEDAVFRGIEIDSEFQIAQFQGGDLTAGVFGDYIRGELDDGADVPRLPPRRVGARLDWRSDAWSVWARVIDADDQSRPGDNERDTQGYTRWDLGADCTLPLAQSEVNLFLKLNNISDEKIRLSTSFLRDVSPEPGRSVEAGIRWIF